MGTQKLDFFFQKSSNFDLQQRAEITLAFFNIGAILVNDTSMERSSRVLQHGNPKIFFLKKVNFEF